MDGRKAPAGFHNKGLEFWEQTRSNWRGHGGGLAVPRSTGVVAKTVDVGAVVAQTYSQGL
jgi:hypothetical protein